MANNSTYNKELTLEEWQEMKRAERDNLFNDINNTAVSVVEDPQNISIPTRQSTVFEDMPE